MMKMTRLILAAAAAAGIGGGVWAMASRPAPDEAGKAKEVRMRSHAVVAYYFHGDFRCRKCTTMEAYSAEALREVFGEEIGEGKLVWRPVNTDREENEHFVEDYQLVTRSLVLAEVKDGKDVRWKNLPRIWKLAGNKPAFIKYVQDETREYLKSVK